MDAGQLHSTFMCTIQNFTKISLGARIESIDLPPVVLPAPMLVARLSRP